MSTRERRDRAQTLRMSLWMAGFALAYSGIVLLLREGSLSEPLTLALLLGTPTLVFLGGFAAALTVGLPRAGVLLPILVLPMLAPVLIFGAGAARAAAQGLDPAAPLYFLAALLALSLSLVPFAAAAALRNALDA